LKKIILAVAVVALAVGALVYGIFWRNLHAPGHAESAHFTADSSKVIIIDRMKSSRSATVRVRVHDARTGAELARARMRSGWRDPDTASTREERYDCIPASNDKMWCADMSGDDGLGLWSIGTLAAVADESRIHSLAPALAHTHKPSVDLDDGALLVMADDGKRYRVGADLAARVEPANLAVPPHTIALGESTSGLTKRAELGGRTLRLTALAGSERRVIDVKDPDKTPHPDQSYLGAGFLCDPDGGDKKPVVLADPPALVLAHVELAGSGKQLVLSRVDGDANLGWSRALDYDEVRGARLVGDVLVVVLRDALIGLDPATGAVRYNQAL
jgi:hypothetical protein